MKIDRSILYDYPLPLARVYERAVNAEQGKDLHDRSLLVFEAFVQWVGVMSISAAREDSPEALASFSRTAMERPSRGIWLDLVRSLAGKGGPFLDAVGTYLQEPVPGPDLVELIQGISAHLEARVSRSKPMPGQVMDLLVSYRNRTVGHGASLAPEAYAALAVPLFDGVTALLGGAGFLREFPLFFCQDLRYQSDGSCAATVLRLMGCLPLREPRLEALPAFKPNDLLVLSAGEPPAWFRLSPMAVYRDRSLFLYNSVGRNDVPRYLSFEDNRQIAEGDREEVLAGFGGTIAKRVAAGAAPAIHLRAAPERIRSRETFRLSVEVDRIPEGQPFSVAVRADPQDAVVGWGPYARWEGTAMGRVPLSFAFAPQRPGPFRLEVEVGVGRASWVETAEVTVHPGAEVPFVGRQEEADTLARWFDGEGSSFCLLRGESGVGKSRLARETALELAAGGAVVVFSKERKAFRLPLQPFRETLFSVLHQIESETNPAQAVELMGAAIRHRMPDEGYIAEYFRAFLARESIPAEQRAMVPYYWLQLLLRSCDGRPVLLVIDDLQWAPSETIQLLVEILGLAHQRGNRVKVLGIVQPFGAGPEETEALSLLDTKLRDLEVERIRVERLELRPLGKQELGTFIDVTFPGNSFRRDLPWLYDSLGQKTGGNPLFTEWVLQGLRAEVEPGEPAPLSSGPAWAPSASLTKEWFEDFVPREIESVLAQRLRGLPRPALDAVQVAAAIGDPFDLRLLEELVGGMTALDTALPVLEEEQLVVPSEQPLLYRFAHSLIPHKVYRDFAEKSQWKVSRLHDRIAAAMASLYAEAELSQQTLAYAHHLVLGNRREEGLKLLIRGAEQLVEQQLYSSAVAHLEEARTLARSGVSLDGADRARLFLRLGETYHVLGRVEDAIDALDSAREEEAAGTRELAVRIELLRGQSLVQMGRLEDAEQIFRSVLSAEPPENRMQMAVALSGLAAVHRIRGRHRDALNEHLRALALREEEGAGTQVAVSCVNLGNTHFDLGEYDAAEAAFQRSVPIFEAKGLKNYLIYALSGLGNVFFRRDRRRAVQFYEEAMRLCRETGNRTQLGVLHNNLGELALESHRYTEARRELERALEIMAAVGRRSGEAGPRCRKAELHRLLGQFGEAQAEVDRAREVSQATGSLWDIALTHAESARLELARGDIGRAREEVEKALECLRGEGGPLMKLECARVLIQIGELTQAQAVLDEVTLELTGEADARTRCALEHLRGLAADDVRVAVAHLERALGIATEGYESLPQLLADLAARVAKERARGLYSRAVEVLARRAKGVEEKPLRRAYLVENPVHREILTRAREAGVQPDSL